MKRTPKWKKGQKEAAKFYLAALGARGELGLRGQLLILAYSELQTAFSDLEKLYNEKFAKKDKKK